VHIDLLDMREVVAFKVEAAPHMLHCRIDAATPSSSFHAIESWRSRKIAFVPSLEWP
jgi:hypothetical protein